MFASLILLSTMLPTQHQTDGAPTAEQVRQAIRRSVPFLEKEGAAWIKNRKCMSCHGAFHGLEPQPGEAPRHRG